MKRTYICSTRYNGHIFETVIVANDIYDAADMIKGSFLSLWIGEDFEKILKDNGSYYDKVLSDDDTANQVIVEICESLYDNIDESKLNDALIKINSRTGEEYYTTNVSNYVKDLVVGVSYNVIYHTDATIIQRFEDIYVGCTETIPVRKELSDYDKTSNIFELDDKVRIKGSDGEFVISSTPINTCNCQLWENVYGICKQDDGSELEIHESELEKVEE